MQMNYPMKFLTKLFFLLAVCFSAYAQDFPEPMDKKLVHDFASFFSETERGQLENMLVSYWDTTSTQVAVVTIPTLHGYEINDYATRLFNKWGIGGKEGNNGVLILIKPKTAEEKGEAFIAPGYGMEGVLPDALVNRIVDNEMIPRFKEGANYEGVVAAVTIIFKAAQGEFKANEYMKRTEKKEKKDRKSVFVIILIIIVIIISQFRSGGGKNLSSKGNLPLWLLLGLLNSGGGRGSFGGFSSGGGGFGGFGGGRSGGGGAGGSW
jgi:uncharacterized protein